MLEDWLLLNMSSSKFLSFYLSLSYDITFSGATKSVYAPEPFDVGRILQVDVISESEHVTLSTAGPIDPGLVSIRLILICISSSH